MKKKISRILGVSLTVSLLASLMVFAAPVSAGDLAWTSDTAMPGGSKQADRLVVSGANITDMAVGPDGDVIYAADGLGKNLYKSTDSGVTWTALSDPGGSGKVGTSLSKVEVAPDDADVLAIIADDTEVYVSTNGGTSWTSLGTVQQTDKGAASALFDIAISLPVGSVRYYAVAGEEDTAAASGNVWYFNLGSTLPAWKESNPASGGLDATSDERFIGVEFSPAFPSDKVILVVTGPDSTADTLVKLQLFSTSSKKWNADAGFVSYPVTVDTITTGKKVVQADIAVPSTYLGADPDSRDAFVGVASNDATLKGSLTRLDDYELKKTLVDKKNIHSVDYDTDADKLVAGAHDDNKVYRAASASGASSSSIKEERSLKGPSGEESVVVAWAGDDVVAGTVGNESAFSVSTDDGYTFNDISLIDTVLTNLTDVAVNGDGSKVYLVSDDGTDVSVWRKDTAWQRVLTLMADTGYLVRIAPDSDDAVYVGKKGAKTLYYSSDGGEDKWLRRTTLNDIKDMAVESIDVAYVLDGDSGKVSKTSNGGFIWSTAKSTDLSDGATIISLSEDNLVVGSQGGYVSYSTDGNSSWTDIIKIIETGAQNVQLAASGLADGDFIYAASDSPSDSFRRWKIGTSTTWSDIITGTYSGNVTGMVLSDGVLYATTHDNDDDVDTSYMYRVISPSGASSTTKWSTKSSSGEVFGVGPSALKVDTGASNRLWAIDTASTPDSLWYLKDKAYSVGPTMLAPDDEVLIPVNAQTGEAHDVVFSWSRLSKETAYDLEIALDEDFTQLFRQETDLDPTDTPATVVFMLGPNAKIAAGVGGSAATLTYNADTTYYWRVRVSQTGPIYSPWSDTRSFTISPVVEPESFNIVSPALGSTGESVQPVLVWNAYPDAVSYEVQIAEDASFAILDIAGTSSSAYYQPDEYLIYDTTYNWKVRGVTEDGNGPWVTGIFTTERAPVKSVETITETKFMPAAPEIVTISIPQPPVQTVVQQAIPDALLWAIVVIGAVLVVALIVLIVRTRRVA